MKFSMRAIVLHSTALSVVLLSTAVLMSAQSSPRPVHRGEHMKVIGVISERSEESFKMTTPDGRDLYRVALTPGTSVRTHRKGVFRGGREYGPTYLLRGLRVDVDGYGGSEGELIADTVRFDEDDLRTAQALATRVDPVEEQVQSNTSRITANEKKTAEAQETADEALDSATRANNRINGLDEYDPVRTITVVFATGSSTLGPQGRRTIDQAAAWVKTQKTKGWMVSVVGHADSTGNTARNKTLSERRANSVIGYLVSKHGLAITKLVQPFGAGVTKPVASNATAAGRAQNRRVEIHLLVNKGIAG